MTIGRAEHSSAVRLTSPDFRHPIRSIGGRITGHIRSPTTARLDDTYFRMVVRAGGDGETRRRRRRRRRTERTETDGDTETDGATERDGRRRTETEETDGGGWTRTETDGGRGTPCLHRRWLPAHGGDRLPVYSMSIHTWTAHNPPLHHGPHTCHTHTHTHTTHHTTTHHTTHHTQHTHTTPTHTHTHTNTHNTHT